MWPVGWLGLTLVAWDWGWGLWDHMGTWDFALCRRFCAVLNQKSRDPKTFKHQHAPRNQLWRHQPSILQADRWILARKELFFSSFPKATAKGSFEKSTTIKDYRSDGCLKRLSSKIAEVMAVFKDCHQRLPKWWLSWKTVIKDCRSDHCLERLSSKATEVMAVCKNCHQRLPKWWQSWKTVIKDYRSDGCL